VDVTRRVEVRIEELVLHGFPPLDAPAVAEAVARELDGLAAVPEPAHHVDAGSFGAASLAPGALGAGIAARLGNALADS
jgi:hypothetical protein